MATLRASTCCSSSAMRRICWTMRMSRTSKPGVILPVRASETASAFQLAASGAIAAGSAPPNGAADASDPLPLAAAPPADRALDALVPHQFRWQARRAEHLGHGFAGAPLPQAFVLESVRVYDPRLRRVLHGRQPLEIPDLLLTEPTHLAPPHAQPSHHATSAHPALITGSTYNQQSTHPPVA